MLSLESRSVPTREELSSIVNGAVASVVPSDQRPQTEHEPLFGAQGALDSVGLVAVIVAVEQLVEDRFGLSVVLADERAMSQRNSPFRSIASVIEHLLARVEEGRHV
jgi:hypothetical protein